MRDTEKVSCILLMPFLCTVNVVLATLKEILCFSMLRIEQSTTGDAAADLDGDACPTGELIRTQINTVFLIRWSRVMGIFYVV